jgi:tungstate transport system substrate-binding protein
MKIRNLTVAVILALCMAGLFISSPVEAAGQKNLILATTTSTQDTGLLDVLNPLFEKKTGLFVKTIAVGSGQAMAMGSKGEADVLLVHSPAAEKKFMADGNGVSRKLVMHNDFIIVGPPSDPAGIKGMKSAAEAFKQIAAKGEVFMSRGDNSGTHAKEKAIWAKDGFNYTTDITNSGEWYIEAGTGMGATLVMADEKAAYTLSDIGTYLTYKDKTALVPAVSEGDILLNVYSVMRINPEKHPGVNSTLAKDWINYLTSSSTQKTIEEFGVVQYGEPLFFPAAGNWEVMGVNQSEVEDPVV